jgi:hypothetical protein
VVAKDTVSPLATLKLSIAEQVEATEVGGSKKSEKTSQKQKGKRSADHELERSGDEQHQQSQVGFKKAKQRK